MTDASAKLRRPRGAPRASNPAVASFYLLWLSAPAMAWLMLTIWEQWDFSIYFGAITWFFAIGCVGVAMVVLLNFGHVQAVALFRYTGFALAASALTIALWAIATIAIGGMSSAAHTATVFVLIYSALMTPMAAVLVRGLLRVRWLDPTSKPSEWEPQPLRD